MIPGAYVNSDQSGGRAVGQVWAGSRAGGGVKRRGRKCLEPYPLADSKRSSPFWTPLVQNDGRTSIQTSIRGNGRESPAGCAGIQAGDPAGTGVTAARAGPQQAQRGRLGSVAAVAPQVETDGPCCLDPQMAYAPSGLLRPFQILAGRGLIVCLRLGSRREPPGCGSKRAPRARSLLFSSIPFHSIYIPFHSILRE